MAPSYAPEKPPGMTPAYTPEKPHYPHAPEKAPVYPPTKSVYPPTKSVAPTPEPEAPKRGSSSKLKQKMNKKHQFFSYHLLLLFFRFLTMCVTILQVVTACVWTTANRFSLQRRGRARESALSVVPSATACLRKAQHAKTGTSCCTTV